MTIRRIHCLLRSATGLDLTEAAVGAAVRRRMQLLEMDDLSAFLADSAGTKAELDALIDLVVVPESWFFRDAGAFTAAVKFTEEIVSTGRVARILSVPCASGEEPYSLAIALHEAGMTPENFSITGIDVSPGAIRRAREGSYARNAFRGKDFSFRNRHFSREGERYVLAQDIRRLVRFRSDNLLALAPPEREAFDIIFCRNLLIYFDEAAQAAAIRKLRALLDDDGLLFCGYAEAAVFCLRDFAMAPVSMAFALRKKHGASTAQASGAPWTVKPAPRTRTSALPPAWPPVSQPAAPPPSTVEPADPGRLLEHANRMADQGAIAEARAACRTYLDLVPDSAEAHFMLGLLSELCKEDADAEKLLRRAIYLDPDHYEALCHLALLAERRGNETGARTFRNRAARVFERRHGEPKQ